MQIPQELTNQFKTLYKGQFGIKLTNEEAQKQGLAVMRLIAVRYENKLTKGENNEWQYKTIFRKAGRSHH